MSDLIDRQKISYAVESLREDYISQYKMLMLINQMPSAEPEERTAKVIDKSLRRHSISDFDWIGKCEKCRNEIQFSFDYCPYCGSRLEWE